MSYLRPPLSLLLGRYNTIKEPLVGQPTFGKGSAEDLSARKKHIEAYCGTYILPDGRTITKRPIQPDIEISLPTLRPKQDLAKDYRLNISKENKEEFHVFSQLPENQYRPAIIWHKDFQQRCLIDPQLATAWTNLSSK